MELPEPQQVTFPISGGVTGSAFITQFVLAAFKRLQPTRGAMGSFLPQLCKKPLKAPASPGAGQLQAPCVSRQRSRSCGWELALHSPTRQEANKSPQEIPATARSTCEAQQLPESPGQVQGNTGRPGARGELNSAISLPRWPGKAERGTAGDGRVTAAPQGER